MQLVDTHCCVIGITRHGKTTTATKLLAKQKGLRLFFNTKNEKEWYKYNALEFPITNLDEFKEVLKNYKLFYKTKNYIVVNPDIFAKRAKYAIDHYVKYLLKWHTKNQWARTTILIDEIHVYRGSTWVENIYAMGAGLGLIAIATAQRASQQIYPTIRNNTEVWIYHKLKEYDNEWLKDHGYINELMSWPRKYSANLQVGNRMMILQ